ncbi:uncharacterized protein LOC144938089 [Lampetra fluviatilis]
MRICEMDQILAVDSTSLVGASQEVATRVLQSTGETVRLVIGREKGAHVVGSEGNSELSVKYKELLIRFAAVTNEVKALKKEVCEAEAAQAKGERQRYLLQTKLKEERRRGEAMETVMATKAEEAERRHRELLRRYRRAVALLAPALIREHGLTAGSHSEDGGGGGEDGGGAGEDGGGGGEDGGGGGELGGDGEDGGDGENGGDGANGTDAHQQQQEQQQQEQQQEQQEQQESSTEENGNVTASQTGAQGPPEDGPRPPGPRPAPYISKGPLWRLGGRSSARPLSSVVGFELPWGRRREPGGRHQAETTPDPARPQQETGIRAMIPSIFRHLSPKQRRKHGTNGEGVQERLRTEAPEDPQQDPQQHPLRLHADTS